MYKVMKIYEIYKVGAPHIYHSSSNSLSFFGCHKCSHSEKCGKNPKASNNILTGNAIQNSGKK